ncbi:MAG: hypothetical protein RLN78_12500 [Phycisphaerales bacterium]
MYRSACIAVAFLGAVIGCSLPSLAGEPVLETFTYQGVLEDGGVPANGMYDIKIQFYLADGTPLLTTTTFLDFEIVDGLMSFPIDYTNLFTFGDRRFLEISVRPAGTTEFSVLSPRQEITASPYSVYAIKAGEAETAVVAQTSLDNEWVRSGDLLSVGDSNESILLNPDLSGGFLLNQFTDLQLNFDDSGFGGIYVNSANSGGSPFYGFAVDNVSEAYIEFSPVSNEMRFYNSDAFSPTLTLGLDTAGVKTLAADDDIVKDYGAGEFYRHGPIAYGTVGSNGAVISGTGNFTCSWDGSLGRYVISVDGESISSSFNTMVANASSTSPRVVTTASVNGDMLVYIHSLSDQNVQSSFSFVIYKNAEVIVD